MKIQIKIQSGSKVVKKTVEVSAPTIFSLLSVKASQELYKKLGISPYGDFGGYVISITDKD